MKHLEEAIFKIHTEDEFNEIALQIFRFQAKNCTLYQKYLSLLHVDAGDIDHYRNIPFLPIEFFKTKKVYCGTDDPEIVFSSSATGGMGQSSHHVADLSLYEKSFINTFLQFYGAPEEYHILALLPSYLEREGSSLIYMVNKLMELSNSPLNGFFLNNHQELKKRLEQAEASGKKCLLLGVSFALLDFVDTHKMSLTNTIVMETGGMKGRRKELIRNELHEVLMQGFGVSEIHSEYGMSELLSQAYSSGKGIFKTPSWMKILLRDVNDPFSSAENARSGGINIIDLANIYSCSFISSSDLGRKSRDGYEVLGRFDFSDLRGCNLMVS